MTSIKLNKEFWSLMIMYDSGTFNILMNVEHIYLQLHTSKTTYRNISSGCTSAEDIKQTVSSANSY